MNHVVYTLYNEAGEALYVGATSRWPGRLHQHQQEKAWFGEVVRHEVERFATGNEARDREHAIITAGCPKYNRKTYHQGQTGPLDVDKVGVKFAASAEADRLIKALADRLGLKQSSVIELAVRKLAEQEGLR